MAIALLLLGDNFRLQKTYDALGSLEKEVKHYENVRKKYKRTQSVFSKLSMSTGVLSVALGSSGLGTSLSGFGLVVGVPLGALAGVFGLTSVGCTAVSKRLSQKVSKHDQTVAMAKAKVNSIRDLVSKALKDNKISDEEFSLILSEVDKFEIKITSRTQTLLSIDQQLFVSSRWSLERGLFVRDCLKF